MRRLLLIPGFLILLSLQSCALTLLNWATPDNGYTLQPNIAYGEHPRQRLDVYSPTSDVTQQHTIVFFYGGSWDSGNKEHYRFVAQGLATQGYQVIIPDYRVYPEVKFPTFLEDAALAVRWVNDNTDQPLVLMGHSAGAHIAAMLALDQQFLDNASVPQSRLAGWIGLSGPYDFLPFSSNRIRDIFSTANPIEASQPITFANHQSIPALLIHGESDNLVFIKNSKNLASTLRKQNTEVTEHYYPAIKHAATIGSFSVRLRKQSPAFSDTLKFLAALKTP